MPEKLMRWNGSEWIEVTSLVRNETIIKKGIGRIYVKNYMSIPEPEVTEFSVFSSKKIIPRQIKILGWSLA